MADLSRFAVTRQYPAQSPDKLQLYSLPTPNGVKVSILLEELGADYEPHFVDITKNETWTEDYLSLNPNGKIPAIIDPDGPNGEPLALFESGAILVYLAEKYGRFLPTDPALKYETLQWVFFQMGAIGPIFGQLGYFHRFAGKEIEDKRPRDRFVGEVKRLLGVLETRMSNKGGTPRQWIMGDEYTIADIALIGWVGILDGFYQATDLVGTADYPAVQDWLKRAKARPAVQRGEKIPAKA